MTTQKDAVRVAAIVNKAWPLNSKQTRPARLGFFIRAMADYMAEDNESFEYDRFLRACGEWTTRVNSESS